MKICAALRVLLTSVLLKDVVSINVTVTPSPFTVVAEGNNASLSCQLSQRLTPDTPPVVRWIFHPASGGDEQLLAKVNLRKSRFYGNYTKSFIRPKIKLMVVKQGRIYDLLVLSVSRDDAGLYSCRVQEFKQHRDRWKGSDVSAAATELRVHVLPAARPKERLWSLFEDVYLCAVLICCVGLLCMCMFTVVVCCQYLQKKRHLKENYHLVKSPQNSSGETVTSVDSLSPALPKKQRRYKTKKKDQRVEEPPEIPAKAPISDKPRKPKLLKPQHRKILLPKIAEQSLTYAELELVKPLPDATASKTGTVYAQILFEDHMV
ncbi:V-set and transmembrane domain-containing protein 4 [Trichomycterus rosablanca]|uniref:V-set and transmembrane domain-containing protein 4 n=1 Tax=Trichomycterus rosablanca TaxID=2290929 RepID=UPI002F35C9D2